MVMIINDKVARVRLDPPEALDDPLAPLVAALSYAWTAAVNEKRTDTAAINDTAVQAALRALLHASNN